MGEPTEPSRPRLLPAEYYEATREHGASETLREALGYVAGREAALDLGSGAGRDAVFLLSEGFDRVVAVDSHPAGANLLAHLPEDLKDHLEFAQAAFDDFNFGSYSFDIINAQYSLPFNPGDTFEEMFGRLKASLKPGGVFAGNFFGDRDEWNTPADKRIYLTKDQVATLFSDMEVVAFEEVDDPEGVTATGTKKHWHRVEVIARKPVEGEPS